MNRGQNTRHFHEAHEIIRYNYSNKTQLFGLHKFGFCWHIHFVASCNFIQLTSPSRLATHRLIQYSSFSRYFLPYHIILLDNKPVLNKQTKKSRCNFNKTTQVKKISWKKSSTDLKKMLSWMWKICWNS